MMKSKHPKDRTKIFQAWLTDREEEILKELAQQQGVTKTALVRSWIQQREPKENLSCQPFLSQQNPQLLKQLSLIRKELNAIGNNVNQIAKVLNITQLEENDIHSNLNQIREQLTQAIEKLKLL